MTGMVTTQNPPRNSWWKQLWVWVLIAMALGIALGMAVPDLAGQMGPLGDAFIKLIRMLIAPIIFCTVVTGIAHMADMARIGRVAIKAIIYFEVMTTIALIIGLVAVNIMQPGVGMNVDVGKLNPSVVEPYVKLTHEVGFVPFLINIIPNTFVGAFSEGNILQVLFIAVCACLDWGPGKAARGYNRDRREDDLCHREHRYVDGSHWRLRCHRIHCRKVRRWFAGVAGQAAWQLLFDVHRLRRHCIYAYCALVWLQPAEFDPLHQGRASHLYRNHFIRDGPAAAY
jgi:Sodium:dicarboxylate symporter family